MKTSPSQIQLGRTATNSPLRQQYFPAARIREIAGASLENSGAHHTIEYEEKGD